MTQSVALEDMQNFSDEEDVIPAVDSGTHAVAEVGFKSTGVAADEPACAAQTFAIEAGNQGQLSSGAEALDAAETSERPVLFVSSAPVSSVPSESLF
jgi:hypothetical protein